MFKTIVWATDGSESADRALPHARTLAQEGDARLIVVHCVEYVIGPRAGGETVHPDEEALQAKIADQVAELREQGIDAEKKIVSGSTVEGAAHLISRVATEAGADLVVVGTRGHTPLVGLLLGSVTERLMHLGPCPILTVPVTPGAARGETEASAAASA